jgi:predicted RNA-binding Zn-ribbon protein involved in translation (DUF1610 family)
MSTTEQGGGQRRPNPYNGRPNKTETYFEVPCPQCGRVRMLRGCDARRRAGSVCANCNVHRAQHRSARSLARLKAIAASQRANQPPEQALVGQWLFEAGYRPDEQMVFIDDEFRAIVDFVLGHIAIEVNGYWHYQRATERDFELSVRWHGPVIFIDVNDIQHDTEGTRRKLLEAIEAATT